MQFVDFKHSVDIDVEQAAIPESEFEKQLLSVVAEDHARHLEEKGYRIVASQWRGQCLVMRITQKEFNLFTNNEDINNATQVFVYLRRNNRGELDILQVVEAREDTQ